MPALLSHKWRHMRAGKSMAIIGSKRCLLAAPLLVQIGDHGTGGTAELSCRRWQRPEHRFRR